MSDYDSLGLAEEYLKTDDSCRKVFFISPTYISLLGNIKGKKVIDFGCGSGFSSRLIKAAHAKEVTGIDRSKKQIAIAKLFEKQSRKGIVYRVGDISNPGFFCRDKYDVAGAELVLHNAKTKKELFIMCRNISKTLKKEGRFAMVNQDPVHFKKGGAKYNETYRYSKKKEGGKIFCTLYTNSEKKICSLVVYNWSKKTYESALYAAGFRDIKWHILKKSPDSSKKLGKIRANKFLHSLPSVGLTCVKI